MEINQKFIVSTFKVETDRELLLGEDIKIEIEATCVKHEIGDNQDGTCNVIYKIKPRSVSVR